VTFGDYRLDPGTRQLFHRNAAVHLSPKAFELLRVLLENQPRAMSKAELHGRLWPATFVTEANLASLVAELRRALGDRAARPKFIRTVHRFGYAFNAPVTQVVDAPPAARRACWIVWRGREIPMRDGENIIGRDPDAALSIDFPSVSRRHARLFVTPDTVTVEDLGSKNGTLLNKSPVTARIPVADLDELQVGSVSLVVRVLRGCESTQTVES
jgi:DNA-binding winged helix-turn-helix (wHTH) protein